MLVQHFPENSAARLPDKVALICNGKRLNYSEINQQADRLASALVNLGIKRRDRVVIFMDNSAESIISLFGILKAGAIFIMVNATMREKKLNYILKDSGARALIAHSNKARIINEALDGASALEHVLWVGPIPNFQNAVSWRSRFHAWNELLSNASVQCSGSSSLLSAMSHELSPHLSAPCTVHRAPSPLMSIWPPSFTLQARPGTPKA